MAYSINTNIASLQAQEYLRTTSDFQSKTINRVTSGLRIISSGDDAAGLAIANSLRSDRAVLTQGVRNANDGLSTLQTIDGGLSNISQLLDRARTLAAQSASGTFTGDRSVLNSEFTNVLSEIDRQSQAIGLNNGGAFASTLGVFIGGGRGTTDAAKVANGSVSVDLSTSTVDAQSLGLKGYQAAGGTAGTTDIGANSATSVSNVIADATNSASQAVSGFSDFYFRGAGFSDGDRIRVSVNLSGVTDSASLATAINSAIDAAGVGGTQNATAFKNAGIRASVVTDSATGKQQLAFTSSSAAFQVAAGDRTSNAFLGSYSAGATGNSLAYGVTGGANSAVTTTTFGATGAGTIVVRIQGGSLESAKDLSLTVAAGTTIDQALTSLQTAVANDADLQAAGISLSTATPGSALVFSSNRNEAFTVDVAGDKLNRLGLGTSRLGDNGNFDNTQVTGAAGVFTTVGTNDFKFSVGGGALSSAITVTTDATTTVADVVNQLNAGFASDSSLQAAGLVASNSAGQVRISSSNGSNFRTNLTAVTGGADLGFGTAAGVSTTTTVSTALANANTVNSGGTASSGALGFSAIRLGTDDQTISLSAVDASGTAHSLAVNLAADSSASRARSLDEALDYINTQIQNSNDATIQKIVAVKEYSGGAEKITFLGTDSFKVSVGDNAGNTGITSSQGSVVSSSQLAGGATADISNQANAQAAVSALAAAVDTLGTAQAVIGRGQNQFGFAVSLAQTQLNNLAASESRIRDADLAAEAANLTKAQILTQAGIAALAQANVAPQSVLSLLRG